MSASTRSEQQRRGLGERLLRIVAWVGGVAVLVLVLDAVGIPVDDWLDTLFDKLGELPPWAIGAGIVLQTLQTTLAALVWHEILRAALPRAEFKFRLVLASYAAAVALNGFLPANIGTFVMMVMLTTLIAGATFTMMVSALVVEKIPFSQLGFLSDHAALLALIVVGAIVLVVLLARVFWDRLEGLRRQLIAGGAILRTPRRALVRVGLPALGSYAARLAIVGVFLGAYGIPVTFHDIATVTASNSISNSVSATPGGVGVTQALNTTALSGSTDAATATAYSISQQLVTTAWNVVLATVLVSWVFGWSGGRALVRSSYEDAKVRSKEMRQRRKPA